MTRAGRLVGSIGLCAGMVTACHSAPARTPRGVQVRTVLSRPLPATNGNTLRTTVVEVAYGPGDSSLPHRHPCAVIGYVIDGAFRSQTEGASETIYRAGESFYEAPNSVHRVSANASATQPVRFTASFICDRDTPLSIELPHTDTTGARER